jgi:capsular exopolysaccharide synthesis family protein
VLRNKPDAALLEFMVNLTTIISPARYCGDGTQSGAQHFFTRDWTNHEQSTRNFHKAHSDLLELLSDKTGQDICSECVLMNNDRIIQRLLLFLKRRAANIVWPVSVCLLLGVIACIFLKPRYRATGEIEIQESATGGLVLGNLTSATQNAREAFGASDANIALQTQANILKSNSLALEVIKDLNLEKTEDFKTTFNPVVRTLGLFDPGGAEDPPNSTLENAPRRRDHAITVFERHLKITPEPGTRLIRIQYTSTDPKIAAAVVNDVAKSLADYTLQSRYAATVQVSSWLAAQLGYIKTEAEQLQGTVERLQRRSGVYSPGLSDAQNEEIAYSASVDRLQQAAQGLLGATSNRISVVDEGRIPSKPLADKLICLALSIFVGFFLGASSALLTEATNDRIEAIATIEKTLAAPILAVLPSTREYAPKGALGGLSSTTRRRPEPGRLAVLDGPNTAYVEALRGLRTSLLLPQGGVLPKTILITSAAEKEGKSLLSLNLAAALGLNGSRVLLIDGDMRSAGLSGYLGFERNLPGSARKDFSGLSDALSTSEDPEIIAPFSVLPRLLALTAGSAPIYPAELLGSERMQTLVRAWATHYDYVLIDSPSLLPVTDALILARIADRTLLVTRHRSSTQKSLERAYHTLHHVEGRSVGVVVNDVHRNSVSFNEFYGYKGTNYYSEA